MRQLLVPIDDPTSKSRLISILDVYFRDTVKARKLLPNGQYEAVKPVGRRKRMRSQETLYEQACESVRQAARSRRLMFEPHRGQEGE